MTKLFCKGRASKLAESDKGSCYNQEKWWKDDKASEKPIETTAESSFMGFLASGASFLGHKAAKWAKKLQSEYSLLRCSIQFSWPAVQEIPLHMKAVSPALPSQRLLLGKNLFKPREM